MHEWFDHGVGHSDDEDVRAHGLPCAIDSCAVGLAGVPQQPEQHATAKHPAGR